MVTSSQKKEACQNKTKEFKVTETEGEEQDKKMH